MTSTALPTPATRPVPIGKTIGRAIWKAIRFVFKTVAATALAGLILAILAPQALFVWRVFQPLNDPRFNGLSLYEVHLLRWDQYQAFTTHYNETHPFPQYPGQGRLITPEICFLKDIGVEITGALPVAILCTNNEKCGDAPSNATAETGVLGYLTGAWTNFEYGLLTGYDYNPHGMVAACRLPPTFPASESAQTTP